MKFYDINPLANQSRDLICKSWSLAHRQSFFAGTLPDDLYFPAQLEQINRLLDTSKVLLAQDPEDPQVQYGYLCYQEPRDPQYGPVIHFLFVKEDWRRYGIAKDLLAHAGIDLTKPSRHTHQSAFSRQYCLKHNYPSVFNPVLARLQTNRR